MFKLKIDEPKNGTTSPKKSHTKQWGDITRSELKAYLSMLIHMGITPAPNHEYYWNKDDKFRMRGIADVMPRDRFLQIKRFLYFNDYSEAKQSEDRLRKLKMIYASISQSCVNYWASTTHLSIDESMIAYTEDNVDIVYMPRKPIKNGFKMFVLADFNGYVMNFFPSFIYSKNTLRDIVFQLLPENLKNEGYHLYMDK